MPAFLVQWIKAQNEIRLGSFRSRCSEQFLYFVQKLTKNEKMRIELFSFVLYHKDAECRHLAKVQSGRKLLTVEKKRKKKGSKKKMILYIVLAIVVFLSIQAPLAIAISNGKFAAGNKDAYSVDNTPTLEDSPLKGKTIIFLGSSVTYGSASGGDSFVEYMMKRDGIQTVKEAVSGTTLVDETTWGKKSYIERMKTIDTSIQADAFVCQLSTNDATMKKPMGAVSDSFDMKDFDTQTVAGAIEHVIAYAKETWGCPVIFYTGTKYDSDQYGQMVELLLQIQQKWDIGVIDLWNSAEMNAISEEEYKLYMVNGIHPSKAGYRDWWTPVFEDYLIEYLDA